MQKFTTQTAQEIIESMSLEEKIGQLFILAFPGKNIEPVLPLIEKYHIGGCYISQDNAETFAEAKQLTQQLQDNADQNHCLPLMLGVDQEGAWGVLIPESTIGPGNLALGTGGNNPSMTKQMYQVLAEEMASVGYQVNLSPCADINLDPKNPIIGTRSFGESPDLVAQHVKAAVEGTRQGGGISTVKHFPGHGDTHTCTHRELPQVNKSQEELLKNELFPFQAAIDAKVDLVMTTHILFPQIDPEYPATLSKKILTDLLRHQMGFEGLIITDSMNMGAMKKTYSSKESTLLALQAGADFIMFSEEHYDHSNEYFQKQIDAIEDIVTAVKNNDISLSLIEEKLTRIINFKLQKLNNQQPSQFLSQEEKQSIEKQAAESAIRILKNENNCIPIDWSQSIAIVNATPTETYQRLMNPRGIGPNQAIPAYETLQENLQHAQNHLTFLNYEETSQNIASLQKYAYIIAVTEDYPLPGEDFATIQQIEFVQQLANSYCDKLVVVGLRSPYDLLEFPEVDCYLTSYSSRTCSAKAMASFLQKKTLASN